MRSSRYVTFGRVRSPRSGYLSHVRRRPAALISLALLAVLAGCSSTSGEAAPVTVTSSMAVAPSAPPPPETSAPAKEPPVAPKITATTRPTAASTSKRPARRPTATVDPLTGGKPSPNPVIAAKIDNTSAGVGVQFGTAAADVIYVEQVEGGLTRLIAVYHSELPDEVGPIRSVRSTDTELLPSYGKPGLAFSGGAGGPLEMLAATDIANLSADTAGPAYWRSSFGDGTHNLHVDVQKLATESGLPAPTGPGFQFSATDLRVAPAARSIQVTMVLGRTGFEFSDGRYLVSNKYGQYVDRAGGQVRADNVLVQRVSDEPDGTVDTNGQPSLLSHTVGAGEATLYRDGKQLKGSWKRDNAAAATTFVDASGKPLPFKPGKTWVLLAPANAQISAG